MAYAGAGLGRLRGLRGLRGFRGLGDSASVDFPDLVASPPVASVPTMDYSSWLASGSPSNVPVNLPPATSYVPATAPSSTDWTSVLAQQANAWTKIAGNILAPQTTYTSGPGGTTYSGPAGASTSIPLAAAAGSASLSSWMPYLLIGGGLLLVLGMKK